MPKNLEKGEWRSWEGEGKQLTVVLRIVGNTFVDLFYLVNSLDYPLWNLLLKGIS